MGSIQNMNVAGLFYPAERDALARDIAAYMAQSKPYRGAPARALVVPHAGYLYSGPVAANAYACVASAAARIHRVAVLAPSHRVGFNGLAVSDALSFATPLGEIPVDSASVNRLLELPQVRLLPQAFSAEHALEVQLPFLQRTLDDFQLIPLLVGDADAVQVADVLEQIWDDRQTLIVVSSDLSHYEDYVTAQRHDARTSRLIEALDEQLDYTDACGRNPLRGLIRLARKHGLRAHTLDLRNSGDTAGSRDRVVGYGAYVFS